MEEKQKNIQEDARKLIGEKEEANNEVSVRQRLQGDLGSMSIDSFMKTLNQAVENVLTT